MAQIERIGNVYYRVPEGEVDAAVPFYEKVLGLKLKFRDGNRWVAFDCGGMTLALEGDASAKPGGSGGATVSLRVQGIDELVTQLRERGAQVTDPQNGPHERRATVTDPVGNSLVLYEPLAR
jgi:predicted enzyme related to lactoylglutathione lyase